MDNEEQMFTVLAGGILGASGDPSSSQCRTPQDVERKLSAAGVNVTKLRSTLQREMARRGIDPNDSSVNPQSCKQVYQSVLGSPSAAALQMMQADQQQAATIMMQMQLDAQKQQAERSKIMKDTQTKIFEMRAGEQRRRPASGNLDELIR